MLANDLVAIGRVSRTHGVRGEVRVSPYTDSLDSFNQYDHLYFRFPDREEHEVQNPVQVIGVRPHKNIVLLKLKGIFTREAAAGLVGADVLIDRSWLPPAGVDEFYWIDLIGLTVIDEQDRELGRVHQLFETGAHDVLVLKNGSKEILIPFLEDVILSIDLEAGVIKAAPPPGLLDL